MKYFTNDWDSDCAIMFDLLESIEFYSGSERNRMLYVSPKIGGSMLYGTTWKSYMSPDQMREYDEESGLYKTKIYRDNPELKEVFKEYASLYFPSFEWTQVQMNKNYPCPPHFDSKNVGTSCMVAFGDYKGGDTCLFDSEENKINKYDARERPMIFNGSKTLHWVEAIKGNKTRYSLVFFNN